MKKTKEKRGAWASNVGFVISAAGSAIGLGNIWKFPGRVGDHGGGTFVLVYTVVVVLIGLSLMLGEIALGRYGQCNSITTFMKLNKKWSFVGVLGVVGAFVILSYYSVIGGWVLKYILFYLAGVDFQSDTTRYFTEFITQGVEPLVWHGIFMALIVAIIIKGVSAGIEKMSKIIMPLLLIVLVIIAVRAVTLPGAIEGIKFMSQFQLEKITPNVIIAAVGQAFYSVSLGMGIMITYGSYVSKTDSLPKSVGSIVALDTIIALLAGYTIICAVFATDPSLIGKGGAGFAFISLPTVFASMPFGNFFGLLFFVLLFFAAITSAMSIMEGIVACLTEIAHMSRKKATILMGICMYVLGCGYSLSQGAMPNLQLPWFDFSNGLQWYSLGTALEYLTDNLLIPLTAFFVCIFVGWVWGTKEAVREIKNGSKFRLEYVWAFFIKYVCPIAIGAILFTTIVKGVSIS